MKTRVNGLGWLLLIAVAGILLSLAVDQEPVRGVIGSSLLRLFVKLLGMGFSAGAGVFSYYRAERRHLDSSAVQAREKAVGHLHEMLVAGVQNIFRDEKAQIIRANVMVAEREELIMLASANMEVFPDYQLRLRRGQGCAGTAWERAVAASTYNFWRPVQATRAQLTKALLRRRWKLTEEQISKTSHILWILSIPLFVRVGSRRDFAGVLNFDGVHEPLRSPQRLRQPDFIGQCVTFGDNLVEVAAAAWLLPR